MCAKFEVENLSENFSGKMEVSKICPRRGSIEANLVCPAE
jgi:hypothetical protein